MRLLLLLLFRFSGNFQLSVCPFQVSPHDKHFPRLVYRGPHIFSPVPQVGSIQSLRQTTYPIFPFACPYHFNILFLSHPSGPSHSLLPHISCNLHRVFFSKANFCTLSFCALTSSFQIIRVTTQATSSLLLSSFLLFSAHSSLSSTVLMTFHFLCINKTY